MLLKLILPAFDGACIKVSKTGRYNIIQYECSESGDLLQLDISVPWGAISSVYFKHPGRV